VDTLRTGISFISFISAAVRSVAPDHIKKMYILRRILNPMGTMDAINFLLDKLRNTKNGCDFFVSMSA
jgi:transcription termination factor Rho